MQDDRGKTDSTEISSTQARGASGTRVTRNILLISLGLVLIFFAIRLVVGFVQTDKSRAGRVNEDTVAHSEKGS
jgi:preprotein translocase subunit SecG